MQIKEIRKLSGLTQIGFAKKYEIPLSTIKGWESSTSSKRYRECPHYLLNLLERVVKEDILKENIDKEVQISKL